jgi:hypothetical protein
VTAVLIRWGLVAVAAILFCLGNVFLLVDLRNPNLRIAFTPEGVLLPRNRWATSEEFVEYQDIATYVYVLIEGNPDPNEVRLFQFTCSKGKFIIAKQKLSAAAFKEICDLLVERAKGAKNIAEPFYGL